MVRAVRKYVARGAAAELIVDKTPEVLIEGPAGTGKTRAVCEKIKFYCERHPLRVLFLRQTRKSMTDSVLVEWEKVLGEGHEAITGTATRAHRSIYKFPNGAEVVCMGLENPERTYSAQYDIIVVFEAHEVAKDAYEKLFRANRNLVIPWQQIITDTNPAAEYHWLNQHFPQAHETGDVGRRRLLSRHVDNPVYFDSSGGLTAAGAVYMAKLHRLTGARRARLLEGLWVSEEGQIWESFKPEVHVVDYQSDTCTRFPRTWEGKLDLKWFYAGVDWGFRNPGSLLVFGVDGDGQDYLVAEWYYTERPLAWWADAFESAYKRFQPFKRCLCDPSRPDSIRLFNDHIANPGGRGAEPVATKANNEWEAGVSQVRWGFEEKRLFVCRGVLQHSPDPLLVDARQPVCLAQEIPSYVFLKTEDGREVKEQADPVCADHACDALRYAYRWRWQKSIPKPKVERIFHEGSFGDILGHDEVLAKSAKWDGSTF